MFDSTPLDTQTETAMRVGYQGVAGAHSEEALRTFAPQAEPVACRTLADLFSALATGAIDLAFVPVENSHAGSVVECYDLMIDYDVTVVAEYVHRVTHHLLGVPGAKPADVERVYSHPQALAQTAPFLRQANLEMEPYYDTAGAARMVAERADPRLAAVASELAGKHYGLAILAESIQTAPDNATRFFLLTPGRWQRATAKVYDAPGKTSLVFAVPHQPGSLVRALGSFARRHINLSKLESRPSRRRPWEYLFIADVEGYAHLDPLRAALDELERLTDSVRVLGSYPAATRSGGNLQSSHC
jgi:prephenate dehydratase